MKLGRSFFKFLILMVLISVTIQKVNAENYICPAEFEDQEAIWLAWSFGAAKKGFPYYKVHLDIIDAITKTQKVRLIVPSKKELSDVKRLVKEHCPCFDQVSYLILPSSTIWFRDTSPVFLFDKENRTVLLQFNDNQWGYDDSPSPENQILIKKLGSKFKIPFFYSSVLSEGGNREVNGKGTLLVVESVELSRNPSMSKKELEKHFAEVLGIKKVIWLKDGLVEDVNPKFGLLPGPEGKVNYYTPLTPGGHVDAFCRFIGPNKILLAEVSEDDIHNSPIALENKRRLDQNFKILSSAADQDGFPFEIIRMPIAEPLLSAFERGDRFFEYLEELKFSSTLAFPDGEFPKQEKYDFYLTTSYLNFLITNESIISAKYWKEGLSEKIKQKDQEAERVLTRAFPDKKIVFIDVYNVNLAGGGIHCMTQYEPKRK